MAELRYFKQRPLCVLPSNVDQYANLDIPRIGEVVVYPPIANNIVVAPMQIRVANWARWWDKDKRLTHSYQGGTCPLAAIRFKSREGFAVVIGFHEDIPWCLIVTHEDIKQQGKIVHDLKDLNILSGSSAGHTDRAKKILSTTRAVTATMRVAPFTESKAPKFGLHMILLESASK
jgi:hypothetical protein